MATVVRLTVSLRSPRPEWVLGRAIQHPAANEEITTYAFRVVGWVVGRDALVNRVEAVQNGRVIQSTRVDANRPALAAKFPETPWAPRSGFVMVVDTLTFEPTFVVQLRAVVKDAPAVPIAVIQGQRQPLRSGLSRTLQPLIVTCLGRTGTTWLMRLLSEHPEIVVYRRFPYEVRPAMYWTHLLKVLSAPADHSRQLSHPNRFYQDSFAVGANPFDAASFREYPDLQEWTGYTYVEKLATFCQDCIADWYQCLAMSQDQPNAAYFAEKHAPNEYPALMWQLFPRAREIILVRDFRDMVTSALAFNARRGVDAFGRQHVDSDEAYIIGVRQSATKLLESWRSRSDKAHLVRYEDLIASPRDTLVLLLAYVGVDSSPATVDGMIERASVQTPQSRQHQTSETPEASIGRWRRDLDPALRAVARDAFGDLLAKFGYDPTA